MVIFSNGLPSATNEMFLRTELDYTTRFTSRLHLVPFALMKEKQGVDCLPDGIDVHEPVVKRSLFFWAGMCLRLPLVIGIFRKDLLCLRRLSVAIVQKIIISLYRAATVATWLDTNAALIGSAEILYFYWADKASLMIPFIRRRYGWAHHIVVRAHGFDLDEERAGGYLPLRQEIFGGTNVVAPISELGASWITGRYGIQSSKVVVSRLGVKPIEVSWKSDRNTPGQSESLRIVSCALAVPLKRLDIVARAVIEMQIAVEWTHIGDGPEIHTLRRLIADSQTPQKVLFCGALPNSQVRRLLATGGFHYFVSASASEGVPVSMMEAMSAGIPIVTTKAGAVEEIVDQTNGFLIGVDTNHKEYAELLLHAASIQCRDYLDMSTSALRSWKNKFDADTNYEEFYRSVILSCRDSVTDPTCEKISKNIPKTHGNSTEDGP